MFKRTALSIVAVALLPVTSGAVLVATAQPALASCVSHVPSDFNGDNHSDVAIGAILHNEDAFKESGAVQVTYGSSTGLQTSGSQLFDETGFNQISPGQDDQFGQAVVAGNFNGDCYADLAITIPGFESPVDARGPASTVHADGGAIAVLYGSASGLTSDGDQVFLADSLDSTVTPQDMTLAAGDFNKDGKVDLAIGFPQGDSGDGSVAVLNGSAAGLSTASDRLLTQDTPGVPGTSEAGDAFGSGLAAADFTGDGYADLAIGAFGEDYATVVNGGSVTVLKGSSSGLTGTGSKAWTEDTAGVPGVGEDTDEWGDSLAAGDITGDGKADLAIGAPGEGVGSASFAGAVTILHGSSSILTTSGAQLFNQNSAGVPGTAETGDLFAQSLAIGDLNGDGHADLAIGDPDEAVGALGDAGTVTVLYGRSAGLTTSGATAWDQDSAGISGSTEANDRFGDALVALPIRSSGRADLVIGDSGESIGTLTHCGAVALIPGSASGLTATGNQLIDPSTVAGGAQTNGEFGWSLA